MHPKVSILIPAYNAEKYIHQAIQSALEQTEQNIEVIVIDDGSTDKTVQLVKEFSGDLRLKLILNHANYGASYTRNFALRESRGIWIALLDADDWYAPERIERLLEAAEAKNADIVADDLYFVESHSDQPSATLFCVDKESFNRIRQIDSITFFESNIKPAQQSPHLGLTKPLMKRNFLVEHNLEYNETLYLLEDFHLYMMCLLSGAYFITIPEAYYFYRRSRPGSASTENQSKLLEQKNKAIMSLLEHNYVKKNFNIRRLIKNTLVNIKCDLEYKSFVKVLKEKGLLKSLLNMAINPSFLLLFLKQLPRILRQKIIS